MAPAEVARAFVLQRLLDSKFLMFVGMEAPRGGGEGAPVPRAPWLQYDVQELRQEPEPKTSRDFKTQFQAIACN